jgi:hypothetical protein
LARIDGLMAIPVETFRILQDTGDDMGHHAAVQIVWSFCRSENSVSRFRCGAVYPGVCCGYIRRFYQHVFAHVGDYEVIFGNWNIEHRTVSIRAPSVERQDGMSNTMINFAGFRQPRNLLISSTFSIDPGRAVRGQH